MSHRKTEQQHRNDGTYRRDRVETYLDPSSNLSKLPPAPIDLSSEAAKVYLEEGKRLVAMGILRPENVRLLAVYASEFAVYLEQMEKAQTGGIVVVLPNGISTTNAHRKAAESALKNATAIGDKLGLSVIGRRRLGFRVDGGPDNDDDPLAGFLDN